MTKNRVFISYSYDDKAKVFSIVKALNREGIDVVLDSNQMFLGEDIDKFIRLKITASETVIVFLSKSYVNSKWANYELQNSLEELKKRNIDIIPISIEPVNLPESLQNYQVINISKTSSGIEKLITRIKRKRQIDFSDFDYLKFEDLIFDLLKEYNFLNIQRSPRTIDGEYDFFAESKSKSPFGTFKNEKWIIEVKFYKHERFSIAGINKLLEHKYYFKESNVNFLLITNSQLTSVAKNYIRKYELDNGFQIEVLDGQLLTNLISNRKRLLDKYFKI